MTKDSLPSSVYRLPQKDFDAIPGSPWIYSILNTVLNIFKKHTFLEGLADIVLGMKTSDNFRFVRYWWEIDKHNNSWVAYEKHVSGFDYYYPTHALVLWTEGSKSFYYDHYSAQLPNKKYWMRPGVNFSSISAKRFSTKLLVENRMCDMAANTIFPFDPALITGILGITNSNLCQYFMALLNPTINYQVIDVKRLPFPTELNSNLQNLVIKVLRLLVYQCSKNEETYDLKNPRQWRDCLQDTSATLSHFTNLISQIDDEVYRLYGISEIEREIIEAELVGGIISEADEDDVIEGKDKETESVETASGMTSVELAVQWISYAVGVVLGRFQPGIEHALGSAIYQRDDFAIGSLPEPSEEEFDQLVGSPDQFAYIDPQGSRHVFPEKVEKDLQALALPDGIAVLDADHERDLAKRVGKALEWMLGEQGAREVIQQGAGGDLSSFLSKDYFTQYHLKWYRKRPAYWYIQSAKRSFGFVLFHEKIDKNTFYTIQHEVANKRKAIQFQLQDLQKALLRAQGSQRKQVEKNSFELHQLDEELAEFAQSLEAITSGGYEPEPDWIDDGAILRMAPLWTVIPLWKGEPKKYWERLEEGDFDWSRVAMKYWPGRVRDKCRANKSFAIAHGHEEWYEGD